MAIFNSYANLPEGTFRFKLLKWTTLPCCFPVWSTWASPTFWSPSMLLSSGASNQNVNQELRFKKKAHPVSSSHIQLSIIYIGYQVIKTVILGYPPFLVTLISTCLGFSSHDQILLSQKPHRVVPAYRPPLHRHKLCCTHPPPTNQWPAKSRHTGYTSPGFIKASKTRKYGWGTRGLVVPSQEAFGSITKIVAGVSDMLLIIWSLWLWHWMKLVRVTTMDQVHETNGFLSGEAGSNMIQDLALLDFLENSLYQ